MTTPVVGFAGMTHLGINSAAAAAARGFTVIAFDPNTAHVAALREGRPTVAEPGLPELIAANRSRLRFTDAGADLARCDLVYVAPDVPTDDEGQSDLAALDALLATVKPMLRPDAVLVVLSQVPPGYTRRVDVPADQRFYQVETLIFGCAVERALHPERFIVGCADPAMPLPPALAAYLGAFGCPVLPMRYESAELCKISINLYLVSAITTANTIAELCERLGADWGEIVPALKLDQRVGPHAYLTPGLGIAGGNLERDLATTCRLADAHGTEAGVVRAWIDNSRHRRDWPLRELATALFPIVRDPLIAMLGLTYKANTDSIKNSPALAFLSALTPCRVQAYDPLVPPRLELHPRLIACTSALAAVDGADALAIMTPWEEFRALRPTEIAARLKGRLVLDPYAVLDPVACRAAGLDHRILGVVAAA